MFQKTISAVSTLFFASVLFASEGAASRPSAASPSKEELALFGWEKKSPEKPLPPSCFEKGLPTNSVCMPPAYNEAAGLDSTLYLTGSFIYWIAVQDNMQIAHSNSLTLPSSISGYPVGSETLIANTAFAPGFKIGIGCVTSRDDWRLFGEYTRLHSSTNVSRTAPPPAAGANGTVGVWENDWFLNTTNTTSLVTAFDWKYKLDIGDLCLFRSFYSGKNLVLEPFGGLRTVWILQEVKATESQIVATSGISNFSGSANGVARCWSIGPRFGLNGNWEIPYGLYFFGNGSLSLLYTEYTRFAYSTDNIDGFFTPNATRIEFNYGRSPSLKPSADMALGLGWATDWTGNFNFDVSLSYEFNVFWNQNMFRKFTSVNATPQSNLYLHGLTASAKVDF